MQGTTPHPFDKINKIEKKMTYLCSPHILTNALDPVTQLVNTRIPVLESVPHASNLVHIQHLGLHPVDLGDLSNLINRAAEQAQRQGLHDQVLDLLGLHLGFGGDGREGQVAVVRGTTEDHLCEGGEGDLLVQEDAVLFQEWVLGDVASQHIVGRQVAAVEGEQQVAQPGVLGFGERVENGVHQQFTEVVDRIGHQGGDTEVICAGGPFGRGQVLQVYASEVEEGILVEGGEFLFSLLDNFFWSVIGHLANQKSKENCH